MKGFNRLCLILIPMQIWGLCRSQAWSPFNCSWRAATGLLVHFSLICYRAPDILKDRTTMEACLLVSDLQNSSGSIPPWLPRFWAWVTLCCPLEDDSSGWFSVEILSRAFTYSLLKTRQMNPREPTSSHVLILMDQGMPTMERKVFCVFRSTRPTENIFLSASHWLTTPSTTFLGLLHHEAPTTNWSPSGKVPEPEKYPKLVRFQASQ